MGIYCKNADRCSYHPSGACDLIFDCVCFEAAVGQGLQSTAKKTVTQMLTAKEAEEQEAFVKWCELNGIPVFHIPNERHGRKIESAGLKPRRARFNDPRAERREARIVH